jgi:sterol 14-demethylase
MYYCLAIRDALYKEQVEHFGNEDGTLKPLSYESLQTPLLNATIKEVLRMHPPIHSLMRRVISDLPVPVTLAAPAEGAQYVIPAGYDVLASPLVSAFDPAMWKDPMSFQPNRWLDPTSMISEDDDDKEDYGFGTISTGANSPYVPFGAGRHRCIGEQFAYLQIGTILATLIREVKMKLKADKVPDPDYTVGSFPLGRVFPGRGS